MKIQILTTPNCTSCAQVEKILDSMGVKYEVIDITKNPSISEKYQVMTAPGIVIDGKLEFTGVPKREELERKIKSKKN